MRIGKIILGFVAVFFVCVCLQMLEPWFDRKNPEILRSREISNARQIILACRTYAADNYGSFPADLRSLIPGYFEPDEFKQSVLNSNGEPRWIYHTGLIETGESTKTLILESVFQIADQKIYGYSDGSATPLPVANAESAGD